MVTKLGGPKAGTSTIAKVRGGRKRSIWQKLDRTGGKGAKESGNPGEGGKNEVYPDEKGEARVRLT